MDINESLAAFYERIAREFLAVSAIPEEYAGPFLVSCPKGYTKLSAKWVYVGQETFGWDRLSSVNDVQELMTCHAKFNLAENYHGRASPFWAFAHELDRKLNPDGPRRSFLWSNIARIGKADAAGRVADELLDFWKRKKLLATEIGLASPMLVMFVTGPHYDDLLAAEFDDIEISKLSVEEPVSQLCHPDLPVLSFRSYHPKFLRLRGTWQRVMDFVVQRTRQSSLLPR